MKWILIVVGVITCSMALAVVSPNNGLINTFGASYPGLEHPLAQVVTRSWGMLITLTGGMLIYAAFNLRVRRFAMIIASISKATFVTLIFIYASNYMDKSIVAVVFDSVVVIVFTLYLMSGRD